MVQRLFSYLTGTVFLLLIPYFMTIFINGPDAALLNRSFDEEDCLPAIVSLEISGDMEPETRKCQAVIARTNFYRQIQEGKTVRKILGEVREGIWNYEGILDFLKRDWEKAVEETKGKILTVDGEIKPAPYHQISGGRTRDGAEVFHSEEYAYLRSVDSSGDKNSPDYLNSTYFSLQQMPKALEVMERDSAGYVMSLRTDKNILEGEAFRTGMGLASANFTLQKLDGEYRFLCKGKGHGLGFSQYGGNELAKEGKTWEEILKVYFPAMEIEKAAM